ncbi:MAG TPA: hypothetical protein ENG61_01120 [Candidatus Korarchaeota archaeon]|nr:hypothetical protein [Candidatus Korarchaeota archaeon]
MLSRARDLLALWKVKLARATGYLTLINSFMLLFLFAQQIYGIPWVQEHFSFTTFVCIAYLLGIIAFLLLAELDWRFIFLKESGYITSKQPAMITECFRSAYMLHKAKEEGKDVSEIFEKLRKAFRMVGYEEDFLRFWEILERKEVEENGKSVRVSNTSR